MIASELRILGAVTVAKRRKYSEVEQERIDRAAARAVMLKSACLVRGRALEAYNSFMNCILSCGWIAQFLNQATGNQLLRFFLRHVVYGAKFDVSSSVLPTVVGLCHKAFSLRPFALD